jgi:hypothetical protein
VSGEQLDVEGSHCIFIIAPTISLWMQNTLSVAIITSALLAATLFTGQTAKAQGITDSLQAGKTVTSGVTQATSNPDVKAKFNLGKELFCGSAAALNGPSGLLAGLVCNYLVDKLHSSSPQQSISTQMGPLIPGSTASKTLSPSTAQSGPLIPGSTASKTSSPTSQPSNTNSPSSGKLSKKQSTSQPSNTNSPSSGKLSKKQSTSQPSITNSPSSGKLSKKQSTSQPSITNSLPQQQQQQQQPPSCSDGSQPDVNGNCPTPPSNNNPPPSSQQQQQTQECPLGPMIPAEETCPSTDNNTPSSSPP